MSDGLSAGVAILKASWASLKMRDEEWIFFWMASSTVRNLSMSPASNNMYLSTSLHSKESQRSKGSEGWGRGGLPLAAVSIVEASSHCWDSRWPRVNQRGYLLGTIEMPWWGWPTSPELADDSSTGSLEEALLSVFYQCPTHQRNFADFLTNVTSWDQTQLLLLIIDFDGNISKSFHIIICGALSTQPLV